MTFKKILRAIAWVILSLVTFISSWLLAALLLPLFTVNAKPTIGNDVAIYIETNGDHTDIVVPVKNQMKDWHTEISYQNTISRDTTCNYVAIGWGDKGFYLNTPTWSQLKFSVAFKAAFGLSTSAIHATFCHNLSESADCKKIMISNAQYDKLVTYIDSTFKRDIQGNVVNIKTNANYDKEDAFYDAKGKYNLFYTCNTWANGALKACGQKACLWTVSDMGIFYHYR
ncbi:MAG TPA: TIGR02117 family protein [Mucilaginibacter sp.]|nr:TIGR02117 family protein [Mucilaginibacter sp.]